MWKSRKKIETPIIPRPVILGLSKKNKSRMHKQTLDLKWVHEYSKAVIVDDIYNYYESITNIFISPLSKGIYFYKGDGRKLIVHKAVLYGSQNIIRAQIIEKYSRINEYALQIVLWNYMYKFSYSEFLRSFAMPLPSTKNFIEEFKLVYKIYQRCSLRPVNSDTHKAFKDFFEYVDKTDNFIEYDDDSLEDEAIYDDYLSTLVYYYLSEKRITYYTNILPEGWSNVTYDLIFREANKKSAAEWILNLKYHEEVMFRFSFELCKTLAIIYMAGIDHNDIEPRNVLIMIPTYANYTEIKIGIVDFGLSSMTMYEQMTYSAAFDIATKYLYRILHELVNLSIKIKNDSFDRNIINNTIKKVEANTPNNTYVRNNHINIMQELFTYHMLNR
jgi:serine/threonine protein kinase